MPQSTSVKWKIALVDAASKAGQLEAYFLAKSMTADDGKAQLSWGPANRK